MRLRQICLVASELAPRITEIQEVLGLGDGYQSAGVAQWGLENSVIPIGDNFLEVVAPIERQTSAGRYLDKRSGDGGYMVIMQADDGLAHRKRLTEMGIRTAYSSDRPPDFWITQYHPSDCNGILLEIDSGNVEWDYQDPLCPWPPAGQDWQARKRTEVTEELVGIELQSLYPRRFARLWSDLLDLPVFEEDLCSVMHLQNGSIRFVLETDGRGRGLSALVLRVKDKQAILDSAQKKGIRRTSDDQIVLCGIRMTLLSADHSH